MASPYALKFQRGVVMFLALITLVILTLTGLALLRSADIGVLVSGNMAMKTDATRSADRGGEEAAAWLYTTNQLTPATLNVSTAYYSAVGLADDLNLCANRSSSDCWSALAAVYQPRNMGQDGAGNTVYYVIQRMCTSPLPSKGGTNTCVHSQAQYDTTSASPDYPLRATANTYYRIFVQVLGPRGTVSYIQAILAL